MTRPEVRWIWEHPGEWFKILWLPWVIAAALGLKAFVIGEPVFSVTIGARIWPILLAVTAGVVASSSLAPLSSKLQAFTASWLFGIAVLRIGTYVHVLLNGELSSSGNTIAWGFLAHWVVTAAIAVNLPFFLQEGGEHLTVEVGRDDCEGP